MAKAKIDEMFAGMMARQQQSNQPGVVGYAADQGASTPVLKCPRAWEYFTGGARGVPASAAIGCDGEPAHFKSFLTLEHARWWIKDGGAVARIEAEERNSQSMITSLLHDLTWEERKRFAQANVTSVEGWQRHVMAWRKEAISVRDVPAEHRIPMLVIVDSLTGRGTRTDIKNVETAGGAQGRQFSDQALSIANFYRALTYQGTLFTLFHVQHAKKSLDPDAMGDEKLNSSGGDEPRFNSTYHFRCTSVGVKDTSDLSCRQLSLKCIRSGQGANKRKMVARLYWRMVRRYLPVYDRDDADEDYVISWDDGVWMVKDAYEWWSDISPFISLTVAERLREVLRIEEYLTLNEQRDEIKARIDSERAKDLSNASKVAKLRKKLEELTDKKTDEYAEVTKALDEETAKDKSNNSVLGRLHKKLDAIDDISEDEVPVPLTRLGKVQISWFDWDFSLGWVLDDILTNGSGDEKKELKEFFPGISNSGTNNFYIKCESVMGTKEAVTFSALGKAVQGPEWAEKLDIVLGITNRPHFRRVKLRALTDGGNTPKKRRKG